MNNKSAIQPAKRRFEELDLARALPLLLIPLVHVYEEFESIGAFSEPFLESYRWIFYLCNLMPSVCMILMGANISFSGKSDAAALMKRGVFFLFAGLLLNVVRFIIPSAITGLMNGDMSYVYGEYGTLYYTITPDIYDFVGLAFIVMGIFRKLDLKPLGILLVSLVMLTIDMIIPEFPIENQYLDAFVGRFIYRNVDSCFPLMNWMIFPAIGYCFGSIYKGFMAEDDRKSFVNSMLITSAVGLAAVWFGLAYYGLDPLRIMTSAANEYITDLANVVMLTLVAGIWFALTYHIYFAMKEAKLCRFLVVISKRIFPFFVAQWIVIGWGEYLDDGIIEDEVRPYLGAGKFWLIAIVATTVAIAAALIVNSMKEKKQQARRSAAA